MSMMYSDVAYQCNEKIFKSKQNQVRGHDPWLKAGSFQAGARRLVGHWRWSCGGQGRNQNPRCSSGPNLVNERPSEVVDKDLQLPHPCSLTCSPRSDSRICQDDRPWSRHFSTRLLQLTPVRHFKGEYRQTPARPE